MGSLRSPTLNALIREFLSLCLVKDIMFEVHHFPGKQYILVDIGSRNTLSATGNHLDLKILSFGLEPAGLSSARAVDLCAMLENTMCRR